MLKPSLSPRHKHLTAEDRQCIQEMPNKKFPFREIAEVLHKDPSTISKEVKKHITLPENSLTGRNEQGEIVVAARPADNGGESACIDNIERDLDGNVETRLFFCDPMRSSQKPHVEKNHTIFRDVCPKGTSFDDFTQEKLNVIASHVNSVARSHFNGKTPYEMFTFLWGEQTANLLGVHKVPANEVIQTPILMKELHLL